MYPSKSTFVSPKPPPSIFPLDTRPLIRVYHDGRFVGYRDANYCNAALQRGEAVQIAPSAIETAAEDWGDK